MNKHIYNALVCVPYRRLVTIHVSVFMIINVIIIIKSTDKYVSWSLESTYDKYIVY